MVRPPDGIDDDDILTVFRASDERFLTTQEVAEQVSVDYNTIMGRVNSLHDAGLLERKWVGQNATWWLAED